MREETIKIFKINELSEKAKARAIDNNRDWNVDGDYWYEFNYEHAYEKLTAAGFQECKIWFSGFSYQGDGACFDCKRLDLEKLIEALDGRIMDDRLKKYRRFLKKLYKAGHLSGRIEEVPGLSNHYNHENTRDLSLDLYTYRECKRLNKLVNDLEEDLEELRTDLCHEIYKGLEETYWALREDEAIEESLEANEVEFTEDGKVWRG